MHPRQTAAATPDKPAIVMAGSGRTVSYGELVSRSNRIVIGIFNALAYGFFLLFIFEKS